MAYSRFEDLPAWQAAARLFVGIDALTARSDFPNRGDLKDQILRAGLSVSNNVAEGFELGSTTELIRFLYIAKGSAGEVRSMLNVLLLLPAASHLRSEISDLKSQAESVSRQLAGWSQSLQNSDIKGSRYLTDEIREAKERKERARTLVESLERARQDAVAKWMKGDAGG